MADTATAVTPPEHTELVDLEASASEAARLMKLAPSATSQHLAKLRAEGVVSTRREGQTIYYGITDPKPVRVIDTLCELYRRKKRR